MHSNDANRKWWKTCKLKNDDTNEFDDMALTVSDKQKFLQWYVFTESSFVIPVVNACILRSLVDDLVYVPSMMGKLQL